MDRHARDLHEQVLAMRMIPVRTLFGRFPGSSATSPRRSASRP
jgi:hypothetical protein